MRFYQQKPLLNAHADARSGAKRLEFGLSPN